ncbi:MAG: glycosyltransferase [Granulosicoccus sp.]
MISAVPLVVIIPTHSENTEIGDTLESLSLCRRPSGFLKTIVVENGPVCYAEAVVRRLASANPHLAIDYQYVPLANKSNAQNEALATLTQNCLILFTDDDVRFDENLLVVVADAAQGFHTGVVFGGPVRINASGKLPQRLKAAMPSSMTGFPADRKRTPSYFLGANYAAFSNDVKRLGGFDPRFGPGSKLMASGDESMMMRTMRNSGFEFRYLPDAIVWHSVDYSKITDEVMVDRRYRGGLERGIRLYLQSSDEAGPATRHLIPLKVQLSHLLAPLNRAWASVGWPATTRANAVSKAAYHQGIIKGWSLHAA